MILLTNNRNMDDADFLEQTIREENMPTSLRVLTVANVVTSSPPHLITPSPYCPPLVPLPGF
ncbi:MAG: hypothetical protein BroJett015_21020 [Chloroflexota bacterium]|nr:MAG: hypothetical protein BroJett015_21020 [Chloroflexota bacterium]